MGFDGGGGVCVDVDVDALLRQGACFLGTNNTDDVVLLCGGGGDLCLIGETGRN